MDRDYFYSIMNGNGTTDYEKYLNTGRLLSCQKDFRELCNDDELQFQIVHQVQELIMKLIAFTLLGIDDYLQAGNTNRVLTLFKRVYRLQEEMMHLFSILDTMSPREYQVIRQGLGNGSGLESPGFHTLMQMGKGLWESYKSCYLDKHDLTIEKVYASDYTHDDAYVVAEALADYDEMFHKFRYHHLSHVQRSIGLGAKSLKGRPVELLEKGLSKRFFPELWEIRNRMTDRWATQYGVVRDSLPS
ncbi:MAG: tryptophan 2,3-dioxygenase [Deltaproteobacteria bacterium]|nr:tryptophan 2,3-dioxygenase [Deltaproteobacteria bacterium]